MGMRLELFYDLVFVAALAHAVLVARLRSRTELVPAT
jgi:low temperature requirement protein LtrA